MRRLPSAAKDHYHLARSITARKIAWNACPHRTRSAARFLSWDRAMADLPRPYPFEPRRLGHHPQLRLQRRDCNLRLRLRLPRCLRVRQGNARTRVHYRGRPHPAASLANLRCPRLLVRDLPRRDFLCRHQLREPALCRGDEHPRFSQAARRDDRPGAAAQIQAREHGYLAALHRPAAVVSGGAVAAAVPALARARRLGAALRADLALQLEHAELSRRTLVLQSLRLAIAVRVRRLVRAGGRATAR